MGVIISCKTIKADIDPLGRPFFAITGEHRESIGLVATAETIAQMRAAAAEIEKMIALDSR
jgi:hypothetical protein